MIRKLLYRFRRMVLVWKQRRVMGTLNVRIDKMDAINGKIAKLDATEMSKGEAYVGIR